MLFNIFCVNREGMDANQLLRSRFSTAVSSVLEDANIASKGFLSSIDRKYLVCACYRTYLALKTKTQKSLQIHYNLTMKHVVILIL